MVFKQKYVQKWVNLALCHLFLIGSIAMDAEAKAPKRLTFEVYTGSAAALSPSSVLVLGEREAVLIDGQWMISDGEKLADMIDASGRTLKAVLITHAHPDHYMGLGAIKKRFPKAKILARKNVRDEIAFEFPAKRLHWQEMFHSELPVQAIIPEVFNGKSITLEGHAIQFIDLPPAETIHATAFYISSMKVLIAGDLIFSKTHSYFADLNNPAAWIEALLFARSVGPIDIIYPGHGPTGGVELVDDAIDYIKVYQEVAKPGVRIADIAREMMLRYPNHSGALMLWLTRGPGFGLAGAKELGVPEELLVPDR